MNEPRPAEFLRFHELLTEDAPEGYQPYYFRVESGSKAPALEFGSWKDERNRLTVDEAASWMQSGGNIGIAGTDDDRLVNVDIDDEDETAIADLKPTLVARSRSRTGAHGWYFEAEDSDIPNIPTGSAGEIRADWQYVVAPGSYVETDPETVPSEHQDEAGYYTIEADRAAARITFDELPTVFRETQQRNQQLAAETPERRDAPTPAADGRSALFDVEATDVVQAEGGTTTPGERWSSLFHGSTTDANMALTDAGLLQCFRHSVTHNGLQAMVVCSDYRANGDAACERVGTPHSNSGGSPSEIIDDDTAIWHAWRYAKDANLVPSDDPVPYRAILALCREMELAPTGRLPDDYDPDGDETIPAYAYDAALAAIEHRYGLDPGRGPVVEATDGGTTGAAPQPQEDVVSDAGDDEDAGNADQERDDGAFDVWQYVRAAFQDPETDPAAARDFAVTELRDEFHFATFSDTDELTVYDPQTGTYSGGGEAFVQTKLEHRLGPHNNTTTTNEIIHRLKSGSYHDRDEFGADETDPKVCVANGVLSLPDGEFSDHDPSELFLTHIPVEYDPDATCEGFDAFLDDILESDTDRTIAFEMLGYCLYPGHPFAKALFMHGDGRNGKSTLLDVFKRFLGRESISSRSLNDLSEDRFAVGDLFGAWANICGDLPNQALEETGTFKKLTGGDLVTADKKYRQPFSFQNKAKLIFSANDPPQIHDDSTAMYRRLLLLNFPNEFTPPGQPGPDARPKQELMDDIASDAELSGILNRALNALQRLFDRGQFSQSTSVDAVREQYKRVSDPIYAFVSACVRETVDGEVGKETLYRVYRNWARENDVPVKAKNVFSRELYKNADTQDARVRRSGRRMQVYQGIELSGRGEEFRPSDDDDDEHDLEGQSSL